MKNQSIKKTPKYLRKTFPIFIYEKYSINKISNNLKISFIFKIEPSITFKPSIIIKNIPDNILKKIDQGSLNNLAFHLGMAEIMTYWKITCSPKIFIKAGYLNNQQISWWKKQILKGMGEYFFQNKINFKEKNFITIKSEKQNSKQYKINNEKFNSNVLVPIGGGKDSLVTLEILKKYFKINTFILNNIRPIPSAKKTSIKAGFKNPIIIDRKLDKKINELNKKGFLNGHTPFSLYVGFASILAAFIFNSKYVAVSNESSANEETTTYLNKKINHQYSKSFEFEKSFNDYSKKYLAKNIYYFSFLRPVYEIQIAKIFSRYGKYHKIFSSCNVSLSKNKTSWCLKCPKCFFVFIMLYPFVDNIENIFGENLYHDKKFIKTLKELTGITSSKPFECIGTKKEVIMALIMSIEKYEKNDTKIPIILNFFKEKILPKNKKTIRGNLNILNFWDEDNLLPQKFEKILKKEIQNV